jgi:hypothetical protein
VTQQAQEQFGDVRFLQEARAVLADIRDIWGANAPKRTELDATVDAPLQIREVQFVREVLDEVIDNPRARDLACQFVAGMGPGDTPEALAGPSAAPPPSPSPNGHPT